MMTEISWIGWIIAGILSIAAFGWVTYELGRDRGWYEGYLVARDIWSRR